MNRGWARMGADGRGFLKVEPALGIAPRCACLQDRCMTTLPSRRKVVITLRVMSRRSYFCDRRLPNQTATPHRADRDDYFENGGSQWTCSTIRLRRTRPVSSRRRRAHPL